MLPSSLGNDSASLPFSTLQDPSDHTSDCQSMDCDQTSLVASTLEATAKTMEGDRDVVVAHTTTRSSALAQLSQRQSILKDTYLPKTELDGLYALQRVAKLQPLRRRTQSWNQIALATVPEGTTDNRALDSYAAPLAPLRERDVIALSALFQHDDIYAIEADVNHRLLLLLPEPCWDDEDFTFLRSFLYKVV